MVMLKFLAIRNPQSAIRNPQSAIRNPQSAILHSPSSHRFLFAPRREFRIVTRSRFSRDPRTTAG
jgi:major type 1 subunit fimbrin (pilin)